MRWVDYAPMLHGLQYSTIYLAHLLFQLQVNHRRKQTLDLDQDEMLSLVLDEP